LLKSVAKKQYQKHFDELEKNYRELEIRYGTVENIARKLAWMRTAPETGLKRMREVVAKATPRTAPLPKNQRPKKTNKSVAGKAMVTSKYFKKRIVSLLFCVTILVY
jgi:hypothetical protein